MSAVAEEKKLIKGGSFLIEERQPEEIFTPEDFTEEHRMIADTTRQFTDNEVTPHIDELEKHETMMGRDRGRLAVAMDLLTDALAMVGQHGIYCQSARHPGKPTMDIAMVLEQIGDAKELLQSVIEAERS